MKIVDLIKEFFTDPQHFFAAMNSEQSLIALGLSALLYLLGLWTGWLIWGRMARRRMKTIRRMESEFNALDAQHKVLVGQHDQLTLDMETIVKEKEEIDILLGNSQRETRSLKNQLVTFKDENIGLQTDLETYLKKIDMMDTQILNLSTKNVKLEEELEETGDTMHSLAAVQSSFNSTRDRLTVVESRISDLMNENQHLRVELTRIKDVPTPVPTATTTTTNNNNKLVPLVSSPDNVVELEEKIELEEVEEKDETETIADARRAVRNAIGLKIKMASIDEKDDLQRIDGIGPFIENQLNELGIYTYEQMCQWDNEMIEWVTTAIEFFPGRIQKDNWKGQACQLKNGNGTTPNLREEIPGAVTLLRSKPTKKPKRNPENLKIIEGIGPKIEKLLKDAGVNTWSDLATAKSEYIQEILAAAGGRFRLAVPDTWPKQAAMAVNDQWKELEAYQDILDGGRELKK